MSHQDVQIAQRRANFDALVALGASPYPSAFTRTRRITDLVAQHGERSRDDLEGAHIDVAVAGRILGIRSFGKASFLVLPDGVARVQVYIRQDALPERDFAAFRLLDYGDIIGVSGRLFRTRTNEFSIWASGLEFLAKCFVPLPEKWHGLQDVELRYRQRYLDLIVNPDVRRVFEVRNRAVAGIREFYLARGFLEVEEPQPALALRMYRFLEDDYTVYSVLRKRGMARGYTLQDMAADYAVIIREEFGGPPDVIGISTGGSIVQHFAADHPDLVRRLVIHSSAYVLSDSAKHLQLTLGGLAQRRQWRKVWAVLMSAVLPQRGIKKILSRPLVWLFSPLMALSAPQDPADLIVTVEAEDQHNFKDRLQQITAPTLVVAGGQDPSGSWPAQSWTWKS